MPLDGSDLGLFGDHPLAKLGAVENLLATEYARETVRSAVAAAVAQAYFQLIAADAQLKLLQDTLALREQTVALQTDRAQAGVIGVVTATVDGLSWDEYIKPLVEIGRILGVY